MLTVRHSGLGGMAGRKKTSDEYFQEGAEANRNGKPKSANPYNWNPHQNAYLEEYASYWDQGWDSEQKAMYGTDGHG